MKTKNVIVLLVLVSALTAAITRYKFPKVEVKTVQVATEQAKETTTTNVKTVVKIVERPDGTKETISETVDNTIKVGTSNKSMTTEVTIYSKPQWIVSAGTRVKINSGDLYYDAGIHRRIAGPIFVGIRASSDKTVGVSFAIEF